MILARNRLTMKINIDAEAGRRASAGRESRGKWHFCFKGEDSGLLPSTYTKKIPLERVGLEQKALRILGQVSLGTFVISILLDIFCFTGRRCP